MCGMPNIRCSLEQNFTWNFTFSGFLSHYPYNFCNFSSRDHEIKLKSLGCFPLISILRFQCLPIGGILNLLTLKHLYTLLTRINCSFLFGSTALFRAQLLVNDISVRSLVLLQAFVCGCVLLVV